MDLRDKVKLLPEKPGVYLMKDNEENIMYVGKAKSLKNRVRQYFQKSKNHAPKILKMIEAIKSFEYIITDTELEALLLECRLIKDIKPEYNKQMKNDRKYVYVKLSISEKYPALQICQDKKEDEDIYYGPFTSPRNVERAIIVIRDIFKIRHCKAFTKKKSGCLNHELGFCTGSCYGAVDRYDYIKQISEVIEFLSGKNNSIIKKLEFKMNTAAEKLDFSIAAKCRDDIFALNHMLYKQKTIEFTSKNRKILAIECIDNTRTKIFLIWGGNIVFSNIIEKKDIDNVQLISEIKQWVLYYFSNKHNKSEQINKQNVDKSQILYSYLRNKKDCMYTIIREAWINNKNQDKLNHILEKLVSKIF